MFSFGGAHWYRLIKIVDQIGLGGVQMGAQTFH